MPAPLSVVIITKNLQWNVQRVLDSVYREIPDVDEVVLVDSASTDRTVELACNYPRPVKVISLAATQRLTAAAGRYVGHHNTRNEFILFLDGDTELLPNYYEYAAAIFDQHPDIGAIGGKPIHVPRPDIPEGMKIKLRTDPCFRDVTYVSGAGSIYRRSALNAASSFSIDIFSDEEPAIGIRIRHSGFRIVEMNLSSVIHYTDPPETLSALLARRGRRLWIGHGQNIRYFMGTGMLLRYLKERGHGLVPGFYIVIVFLAITHAAATGNLLGPACALLSLMAAVLFLAVRHGSFESALLTIVKRFMILEGTIRGLMDEPLKPEDYHLEYQVIKT